MPQSPLHVAGTGSGSSIIPASARRARSLADRLRAAIPEKLEPGRMFFHIVAVSAAGVLSWYVDDAWWRSMLLIAALALGALYECIRTRTSGWLANKLNQIKVRDNERHTRAASMDFMLGLALSFLLFERDVLLAAIMVTAWCDPMARFAGVTMGKCRWPGSRKTLEGSIICGMIAAVIGCVCLPPLSLEVMAALGVTVMCAELIPQKQRRTRFGVILTPADNFYIPLAAGLVLTLSRS